jgi:hypothetical protein
MAPHIENVGGYTICSAPSQLHNEGIFELAVKRSSHPVALWLHEKARPEPTAADNNHHVAGKNMCLGFSVLMWNRKQATPTSARTVSHVLGLLCYLLHVVTQLLLCECGTYTSSVLCVVFRHEIGAVQCARLP